MSTSLQSSTLLLSLLVGCWTAGCGTEGAVGDPPAQMGGAPPVVKEVEEDEEIEHEGPCSLIGTEMVDLVNAYRVENGLPSIEISVSLCLVAQLHVEDLAQNHPYDGECSLHSWSDSAEVTGCCYQNDNSNPECMWDKPSELTEYPSFGYESVAANVFTAAEAVEHFQGLPSHAELMLEQGIWADANWMALGAAYQDGHATIWFGKDRDPVRQ